MQKKLREQSINSNGPSPPELSSQQQLPQQQQLNQKPISNSTNGNNSNRHEILMDEFKKAHRKMFKNGFVENEYQQRVTNDENGIASHPTPPPSKLPIATSTSEVSQSEQQLTSGDTKIFFSLLCGPHNFLFSF